MKLKIIGTKMLVQCPSCMAIKMETNNKHRPFHWQKSIAEFDKLPKELCLECKQK